MKQGLKGLWELQMDCQNAECSRTCLLSQSSFCLQRVWHCSLLCVCLCFLALNGMEGRGKAVLPLLPHPLLMLLHLFRVWWSLCKAGKTSSLSCLWKCIPPNLIVNEQASGGWWAPAGSCRRTRGISEPRPLYFMSLPEVLVHSSGARTPTALSDDLWLMCMDSCRMLVEPIQRGIHSRLIPPKDKFLSFSDSLNHF